VLLSGLRISHVAEDRSIPGHLLERAIVLVELFFSSALAGRGSARATGARHGLVAPRKKRVMWLCRRVRFVVDCRWKEMDGVKVEGGKIRHHPHRNNRALPCKMGFGGLDLDLDMGIYP
jgi:hypothetical protein